MSVHHVRVVDSAHTAGSQVLRVRFAADTASVPGARRFVVDGLTAWGRDDLADDAALCVSELAANAALHSASRFMEVTLTAQNGTVLISVEDDSAGTTAAVVPRAGRPGHAITEGAARIEDEPTTGRGLAIVSILASSWGVDQLDSGKRIWAQLTHDPRLASGEVRSPETTTTTAAVPHTMALPAGWSWVQLAGCPVELSLRQDDHLDELVRELQLIDDVRPQELSTRLRTILSSPAHARHSGRRQAELAALAGREAVDVTMAMPDELSRAVLELHAAVLEADQLCRESRLLTLESSPDVRGLREWMAHEVVEQIEHSAAPIAWADWLSRTT